MLLRLPHSFLTKLSKLCLLSTLLLNTLICATNAYSTIPNMAIHTSSNQQQQHRRRSLVTFLAPSTTQSSSRRLFHDNDHNDDTVDKKDGSDKINNVGSSSSSIGPAGAGSNVDDNDDDVDDGQYYDGEYDFDFIEGQSLSNNEGNGQKTEDPFNAGLNQWFEDRNRRQPILLTDLLGNDDEDEEEEVAPKPKPPPLIPVEDFQWFESTLRDIEYKYDARRQQLEQSLNEDRLATPTTVPMEANAIMEQLLEEEMESEIKQTLVDMRIARREKKARKKMLVTTAKSDVKEILQQAQEEMSGTTIVAPKVDEQQRLSRKRALYVAAQVEGPSGGTDNIDYKAMDRLEENLLKGNERRQLAVEEKVANVRERLEARKSADSSFKPDNYADWKKYQEIKLFEKSLTVDGVVNEKEVQRKFWEWKEFMARQDLTMQAFQEEEEEIGKDLKKMRQYLPEDRQARDFNNVVADINRKALSALENVLEKRQKEGAGDTADLEERISKLRESLEAVNYVDVQQKDKKKKRKVFKDEPIDFSEVFPRQAEENKDEPPRKKTKRSRSEEFLSEGVLLSQELENISLRKAAKKEAEEEEISWQNGEIDYFEADDDVEEDDEDIVAVPDTPFFSSTLKKDEFNVVEEEEEEEEDYDADDVDYTMSGSDINRPTGERSTKLLGTYDEQRMKNLYRQGGAATEEEKEEVKQSYEDFQKYQEEMMKKFETMDESDLGYDLSDVMTEDGDIDSAKVLSFIDSKAPSKTAKKEAVADVGILSAANDSVDLPATPIANTTATSVGLLTAGEVTLETLEGNATKTSVEATSVENNPLAPIYEVDENYEPPLGITWPSASEVTAPVSASGTEPYDPPLAVSWPTASAPEPVAPPEDVIVVPDSTASTDDTEDKKVEPEKKTEKSPAFVVNSDTKTQEDEAEKAPAFIGKTDINTPAEERGTALLGTYEDQAMKNLYRETGLKDKEEQEKFRSEFEEFQKYQEEAMQAFEEEAKETEEVVDESPPPEAPPPLEPISTAEVELGPKPSAAERKRRLLQGNNWKPSEETATPTTGDARGSFLGQKEVGVTDDDDEEVPEEDFEENKRRIEQALGINRPKSGGIDIIEVLGRRPGQDDDFEDDYRREEYVFPVRKSDADLSSYQLRKNMLLERRSLSVMEVNSLMDMKDTLEVEGVSPYMSRINKPFREFGAIFRLEGVLVDITPLEMRAWTRVAENLQLDPPSRDDVRLASVQVAEYAVSRIFYWTSDYQQCREIAAMHKKFINEEVKAALGENADETGGFIGAAPTKAAAAQPVEEIASAADEGSAAKDSAPEERRDLTRSMYIIFAEKYGFRKPTDSELDIAAQLSPAEAVEIVFEWAREGNPIGNIVSALKGIYDAERTKLNIPKPGANSDVFAREASSPDNDDAEIVVVEGATPWIKALLDVEMTCGLVSYLDAEIVNLIMDKAGLTNLIPLDQRVTASDGYGRDSYQQLGASLRIDRRPDMCVLFDGNADALMAARDNEMKSIGITSIYPSYELLAADTTARTYDYLTAMNIRRLFGERDTQEPLLQEMRQEPKRPSRPVLTIYPEDEQPHRDDVADGDYETDSNFRFDDARYYDDDTDRYYGDDKYKSRSKNKGGADMPDDGGIIDDNSGDLFQ